MELFAKAFMGLHSSQIATQLAMAILTFSHYKDYK